jgi:hypothetical protein
MEIRVVVPQNKLSDPRLLDEFRLLCEELATPGEIKKACIHEVGHLFYFRLLGLSLNIASDEFWFVGPTVTCDLNTKQEFEFDHFIAATRTPFREDELDYTDETLIGLAKACVAGGVFTSYKSPNATLVGDAGDRKKFHRYYNAAIKKRGQMDVLESQLKQRAIDQVTADLLNPMVWEQALVESDQIEVEHFS